MSITFIDLILIDDRVLCSGTKLVEYSDILYEDLSTYVNVSDICDKVILNLKK